MADPALWHRLRLCVVTTNAAGGGHEGVARAALAAGAPTVQLRAPEIDDDALRPLAARLAGLAHRAGALLVVNDRTDVAAAAGAHGVHLGQGDRLEGARDRLPAPALLGVSVATPSQAQAAARTGADYLGVTVWSTATKPDARPVGLDGLRRVVAATSLPVVAIGGVDVGRVGDVLAAGARGVAVVSAVAAAPDPGAAVARLLDAVASAGTPATSIPIPTRTPKEPS